MPICGARDGVAEAFFAHPKYPQAPITDAFAMELLVFSPGRLLYCGPADSEHRKAGSCPAPRRFFFFFFLSLSLSSSFFFFSQLSVLWPTRACGGAKTISDGYDLAASGERRVGDIRDALLERVATLLAKPDISAASTMSATSASAKP